MSRRASHGHYHQNGGVRFSPEAALAVAFVEQAVKDLDGVDHQIVDEAWHFLTDRAGRWKQARADIAGLFMDPDVLRDYVLQRWPKKPEPRPVVPPPVYDAPAWKLVLPILEASAPTPMTRRQLAETFGIPIERVSTGCNELKIRGLATSLGSKIGWVLAVPQTASAVPSTTDHLAA